MSYPSFLADMILDLAFGCFQVIRVDKGPEYVIGGGHFAGCVSKHCIPAWAEVCGTGGHIPVPDTLIGRVERESEALFAYLSACSLATMPSFEWRSSSSMAARGLLV